MVVEGNYNFQPDCIRDYLSEMPSVPPGVYANYAVTSIARDLSESTKTKVLLLSSKDYPSSRETTKALLDQITFIQHIHIWMCRMRNVQESWIETKKEVILRI